MRPRSGRISPATALTSEVLPDPERPNSAVRPAPLSKAASRRKSPRRCWTATLSIAPPATAPGRAAWRARSTPRRRTMPASRSRSRRASVAMPRDRRPALGSACRSPAEREDDAQPVGEKFANQSSPAEQQQQDIAGDDRRDDERQMHDDIEQRLSPELSTR